MQAKVATKEGEKKGKGKAGTMAYGSWGRAKRSIKEKGVPEEAIAATAPWHCVWSSAKAAAAPRADRRPCQATRKGAPQTQQRTFRTWCAPTQVGRRASKAAKKTMHKQQHMAGGRV